MILEQLLHDIQKVAPTPPGPIASFEVPSLTVQDLVILASSTSEGYSAGNFTVLYSSSLGDVVGEQDTLTLGQYQYIYVNSNNFKIRIDPNFWLTNLNIKIWKGKPDMPFSPIGSVNLSFPKAATIPSPTFTPASATAVSIANSRTGRCKLIIYNQSNGTMFIRYAATGTGTNATASNGGWDEQVAPNTAFEYPGPALPPESAINAIWVAPGGATLTGSCTVTEAVSA